ncbi:acyl-CoA dehydrogenase family protein [Kutzneria buriramensis]|uniref:Alkylation response protein AidB-like acyl-CoA dehydrogenase n=1 Tax=Kutzneria buriramensis TaxID=1045776 RepID=A0A3E0HHY1_9PSEU|nr:acyl-CoA dehydrogenase family protein [Kutzneria buriramensis]REH46018.1 alkylation response protein AidB-like acyl-CoA dehydrogenase [Kutzneria buriramensis]
MTVTEPARVGTPMTGAEIIANARALAPILRKRSAEIEKNRRLPADVVQMLRDAGVFRMGFSRAWGGPEMTSMEQTEVIEALSYGDPSVGWCVKLGSDIGLHANFLDQDEARRMFPSIDMHTAGVLLPAGRADRVPGGYRLSGRWAFGSGSTHVDWVASGAFVYENGEPYASPDGSNPHESRLFMVPREQIQSIDNWHTIGLCGSGSCDYTITDVFVPENHSLTFDNPKVPNGPLVQPDVIQRSMPGIPLGAARAALDHVREVARTRVDRMSGTPWRDLEKVQITLAECEADYVTARAGVYQAMQRQWDVTADGVGTLDDLTPDERIAPALTCWQAFRMARSVLQRLCDLFGTATIYSDDQLGRWLRDVMTMGQHLTAKDRATQTAGAYVLGGRPSVRFMLGIVDKPK